MYCSQKCAGCDVEWRVGEHMQEDLETLLYHHGVHLGLYGHFHSYQRTCAMYNNACVDDGIVHVVAGTAGVGPDRSGPFIDKPWSKFWWVSKMSL
jgi:hypothetical protein